MLKKEEKIQKLHDIAGNLIDLSFPYQFIIETTAYCNMKCTMCGHSKMKRPKGNMSMPLYKKIIDEIASVNKDTEVWMTFYGDALILGYKLYYMIEYAKKKGLTNVVLNSNAMLLNDDTAHWLIESGLDRFIISMDAFTKKTYESLRIGGIYEEVVSNVQNLIALRKKSGLKKPKIEIQFSIMEENEHEFNDFRKFWVDQGILVKYREKLTWTGEVDAPNLDPTIERIPCPWGIKTCAIHWNGDIVMCAVDYEGAEVFGNVNDDTIQHIWQTSHRAARLTHLHKDWNNIPKLCSKCLDWQAVGAKTVDSY